MNAPWAALTREGEYLERQADQRMARAAAIMDQWKALDRMLNEAVKAGDEWFNGPMDEAHDAAQMVIKRLGEFE